LHQNYPNPFNPTTAIRFDLAASQPVALSVFATDGSLVATLIDAPMAAGPHEVFWNGRDAAGRPQPSGVYYYRLDTGHQRETRSMVLLK
jgi:flagellar hook assembly protein FlgD